MQIYTSVVSGVRLSDVKKHGLGFMISSTPDRMPGDECKGMRCALDNGAYISWRRGYPFFESIFMKTLEKCYKMNIKLDFIVIPDIVAGGMKSLDFSSSWLSRLSGSSLALAVQDGITPHAVELYFDMREVNTIFIGGTVEWKWSSLKSWKEFCDKHDKQLHVGRCGTLDGLTKAEAIGVDSVDSSSFVRNESWGIIEDFRKKNIPRCPSCGSQPVIGDNGMIRCKTRDCMMMGVFCRSAWDRHCNSGDML